MSNISFSLIVTFFFHLLLQFEKGTYWYVTSCHNGYIQDSYTWITTWILLLSLSFRHLKDSSFALAGTACYRLLLKYIISKVTVVYITTNLSVLKLSNILIKHDPFRQMHLLMMINFVIQTPHFACLCLHQSNRQVSDR